MRLLHAGVLTFEAYLRETPGPLEDQVRETLSANLCRCTGYQNAVKAILKAAAVMRGSDGEASRWTTPKSSNSP